MALNIPSTPSRTGYTFGGWALKAPQNCFANLANLNSESVNIPDSGYTQGQNSTWWVDINESECLAYEYHHGEEECVQWRNSEVYGRVSGLAKCSSTGGTVGQTGTPSDTNGGKCWCKVTNYTPSGGSQCAVTTPVWKLSYDFDKKSDAEDCALNCADSCIGLSSMSLSELQ